MWGKIDVVDFPMFSSSFDIFNPKPNTEFNQLLLKSFLKWSSSYFVKKVSVFYLSLPTFSFLSQIHMITKKKRNKPMNPNSYLGSEFFSHCIWCQNISFLGCLIITRIYYFIICKFIIKLLYFPFKNYSFKINVWKPQQTIDKMFIG